MGGDVLTFLPRAPQTAPPTPPVFRSSVTVLSPAWVLLMIAGLVWLLRES